MKKRFVVGSPLLSSTRNHSRPLAPKLLLACLCAITSNSFAADTTFQNFLFTACGSAGGELAQRCAESAGGDLSSDSESSLKPIQLLSRAANTLQETVANVRAIREQNTLDAIDSATFGKFSLALYSEDTRLIHNQTSVEYGYQTNMESLRISLDYRYNPQTFGGVVVTQGKSDTRFDKYRPSGNFPVYNPNTSGGSDARSRSVGLLGGHYFNDALYVDALLLYTRSDFDYSRKAIFQSANLSADLPVTTRSSSSGQQFAAGLGAGIDQHWNANSVTAYARLDFQRTEIDGYRERGGNGFALKVNDVCSDQLLTVLGMRFSHVINLDSLVMIPQGFAEYQQKSRATISAINVTLLDDNNQTPLQLRGGSTDNRLQRLGVGIAFIWPRGINGFANINRDYGEKNFKRHQFTAGVKLEF